MGNLFISVVSHGHGEIITNIDILNNLSDNFHVVIKNNIKDKTLEKYCRNSNIHLIDSDYGLGFGENNNLVFDFCCNIGMNKDDYFLVLNPDVIIEKKELFDLTKYVSDNSYNFSTINLYRDKHFREYDNSIRHYPTFINFFNSFIGKQNSSIIDKKTITEDVSVDWAAGSFLLFKSELFRKLKGFDLSYFMYCEDIDICYRSNNLGERLMFIPRFKAIHFAQHTNRKILSRHFYWHLSSALKFLITKLSTK